MSKTSQWEREKLKERKWFPDCTHEMKDCCNIDIMGKCRCLDDTFFEHGCPFYRSWTEVDPKDLRFFPHNMVARNHRKLYWKVYKATKESKGSRATSERIRLAREYAGISPRQMAEHLGMSTSTYIEYEEKAPEKFTLKRAMKIAELTGIRFVDLFAEV